MCNNYNCTKQLKKVPQLFKNEITKKIKEIKSGPSKVKGKK